jgi:hypothetical protein
MKKKLVLSAMLVALLALGLTVTGCPTEDDDDSGGGGGGSAPAELVGKWYKDAPKTSFAFQIYENGGVDDAPDKPNEVFATITMKSGDGTSGVFTARHNLGVGSDKDITFTTSGNELVVSDGKHMSWIDVGTYYK